MSCRNGSSTRFRKGTWSSIDMSRRSLHRLSSALLLLGLAAVMVMVVGCSTTTESENLSSRPWNTPKNWEHGLPSGMFEGR